MLGRLRGLTHPQPKILVASRDVEGLGKGAGPGCLQTNSAFIIGVDRHEGDNVRVGERMGNDSGVHDEAGWCGRAGGW